MNNFYSYMVASTNCTICSCIFRLASSKNLSRSSTNRPDASLCAGHLGILGKRPPELGERSQYRNHTFRLGCAGTILCACVFAHSEHSAGRVQEPQTRQDQTRPDQTRPDQITPRHATPRQTRPDQTRPDQTRPDHATPRHATSDQTRLRTFRTYCDRARSSPNLSSATPASAFNPY
jgi:hypothetical protein